MENGFRLAFCSGPTPLPPISKLETTSRAEALADVFDRVIIGLDRIIGGKLVITSNSMARYNCFTTCNLGSCRGTLSVSQSPNSKQKHSIFLERCFANILWNVNWWNIRVRISEYDTVRRKNACQQIMPHFLTSSHPTRGKLYLQFAIIWAKYQTRQDKN